MYAYIKGILVEKNEDLVVVENQGIGYNIKVSISTSQLLPQIGSEVKIYTYTLVREDQFSLYGFLTSDDLYIFKKLITVNGIGPKGGLSILSIMNADSLRFAIISGDAKAIAKAPGIGNKSAERVILDLKDKISPMDVLSNVSVESQGFQTDVNENENLLKKEAIEALVALGYSLQESTGAVKKVEFTQNITVEEILKQSLKNMY